jgi:hypothetical protein
MLIPRALPLLVIALGLVPVLGCKGKPDEGLWCSDSRPPPVVPSQAVTWHHDIRPIVAAKCGGCHVEDGSGPFPLQQYEDFTVRASAIGSAVFQRHMPPWLAERCCAEYRNDLSLTNEELGAFERWLGDGMPEGSPQDSTPPPPLSGLSRVDVTVSMKEDFVPQPPAGHVDELRCFVLDWPLDRPAYVTGLNPRPGNRAIVHHLIVGAVSEDDAEQLRAREGRDGRPGFDCTGGLGSIRNITVLGGSLMGSDFPDGIGKRVEPGSKILLNVHYSMAYTPAAADRTAIEFRLDDEAREAKGIAIANPAWLVGDAMRIKAGDPDAAFWFHFRPTVFTGGKKTVYLRNVTPHMHAFATRFTLRILRADGSRQCLLEIPRWDIGWEQPYWFARPIELHPEDELYIECHFDNSAARQPPGQEPRDIAWGESNQDMCVGFLAFTEEP